MSTNVVHNLNLSNVALLLNKYRINIAGNTPQIFC